MKVDLSGKSALITGSTGGIGFAIANQLAANGATVYINGRTAERVNVAVKKIQQALPEATVIAAPADLETAQGAAIIYKQIPAVDILINNLGIFEATPFFEISDADWQRFFDINIMSAVRMSRHFTPAMVKKKWGRVMFISSESAILIPKEMVHYGMTKTAMLSISRGLAETVAGSGVTVNAIMPGPTRTEGVEKFVRDMLKEPTKPFDELEKEFFRTARPTSLIQRFATMDEVANLVTYIASPDSSATTGVGVRVDGGTAPFLF